MSVNTLRLIDSTLREGEQFVGAYFTSDDKLRIADALEAFGIDYIELTSPRASPQSDRDVRRVVARHFRARVLTHIRCHLDDLKYALDTGVHGVNVAVGLSRDMRRFSHGLEREQILERLTSLAEWARSQAPSVEIRVSTEDTFRTDSNDLHAFYSAVEGMGVSRIGIADTVGTATPGAVIDVVSSLRRATHTDIEFHGHNDTGCAIANAFVALQAGATHIDVSILGIGERNGITPLGGLLARLYASLPDLIQKRYVLTDLPFLDQLVSSILRQPIPFNNYITGSAAFAHKAGIHTKAVLAEPHTYEAMDPSVFAVTRVLDIAHHLTGRHAIKERAERLGFSLVDKQIRHVVAEVKAMAATRRLTLTDVDDALRAVQNMDADLRGRDGSVITPRKMTP